MPTRTSKPILYLTIAGVISALVVVISLPSFAQAAPSGLPPRFTPTPVPAEPTAEAKTSPHGALISLEVQFGESWPSLGIAWQDLWTVVQWQDNNGEWNDVVGWRGSLDKVSASYGWKTWWLPEDLYGLGPFRWVIYELEDGSALFTSDPFNLPSVQGQTVLVEAALAP